MSGRPTPSKPSIPRDWVWAAILLAPPLILLIAFTHWPVVETAIQSLWSTPRGRRAAVFVGLENYRDVFADPVFAKAFWNNIIYAALTIPAAIIISLSMALAVHRPMRGTALLRMSYFTPTVLPLVAVANIWLFFYQPGIGLFDQIRGVFGFANTNLVGQPDTALYAVAAVAVWKEAGFFMIFYLAALQSISPALRDAAMIEGCGKFTYLRRVIWPLIAPTTLFIGVNATINAFRLVDHIYVMTGGGPDNASMLLLYQIYETGFRFWDSAPAAAMTMILVTLLAVVGIGQFFLLDRKVHYR